MFIYRDLREDMFGTLTVYVLSGTMNSARSKKLLGDITDRPETSAGHDMHFDNVNRKERGV